MQLEYFEDLASHTRLLLTYGDDPGGATVLRRATEELVTGEDGHSLDIARLPGFNGVDGCSLFAAVGSVDHGVEPLDGSERAFRCVLRPATWENVSGLLAPFETRQLGHVHQYLDSTGPVLWIVSSDRSW
jgi:hypothetical protein